MFIELPHETKRIRCAVSLPEKCLSESCLTRLPHFFGNPASSFVFLRRLNWTETIPLDEVLIGNASACFWSSHQVSIMPREACSTPLVPFCLKRVTGPLRPRLLLGVPLRTLRPRAIGCEPLNPLEGLLKEEKREACAFSFLKRCQSLTVRSTHFQHHPKDGF